MDTLKKKRKQYRESQMHNKTIHVLMVACKFEAGGAPRSMMDMILNLQKNHNVKVTLAVSGDERLAKWCRI